MLAAAGALAVSGAISAAGENPVTTTVAATSAASTGAASAPASAPADAIVTSEGWFAPPAASRPRPPAEISTAFVIPIHEVITAKTYDAVRRKVVRCRANGAQMVIFDMNTLGGEMGAMLDIFHLIADDMPGIFTVAYVNPKAISAGAIISLACDEIDMAPPGIIGDAMPVQVGQGGYVPIPKEERGKIESYIKAELRSVIQRKGYNEALCQAMVTLGMEIWLIRNRDTGQLQVVSAAVWRGKLQGAPPSSQPQALESPAGASQWEYVRTVNGPDTLVTLTAGEAVNVALAGRAAASLEELQRHYHVLNPPQVLEDTWSEQLVEFLTSATLSGILMFIGIICIYMELQHPGLILPAVIGGLCFAVIFGSRYLIGMSDWWPIALFFVGVILVVVELFLPTFGFLGFLGAVMVLAAFLALAVPSGPGRWPIPKTDLDWSVFEHMLFSLGVGFVSAVVAIALFASYLPRIPVANRLVLAPVTAAADTSLAEDSPARGIRPGDVGIVEAVCKPIGKVRFGGDLLDAVSDGMIIEPGSKVRVLRREGNQIFVENLRGENLT